MSGVRALFPLAMLLLAACDTDRGAPRRVFFITVDTLRADHLGAHGYPRATSPFLDRLAAKSTIFERAIVQWPKTGPSFASMFTGQYPHTTGLTHKANIRIPEGFLTLPEMFQAHGYRTVAVNSNGVLNSDLGWDAGFDEYLETRTAFGLGEGDQQELPRHHERGEGQRAGAAAAREAPGGEETLRLDPLLRSPHSLPAAGRVHQPLPRRRLFHRRARR